MYRFSGQRSFGNNANRQEQSNFGGGGGGRDRYNSRPDNRDNDRGRDSRSNQIRLSNNANNNNGGGSSSGGRMDRNGSSGRSGETAGSNVTTARVENGSKSSTVPSVTTTGSSTTSSSSSATAGKVSGGSNSTNLTVVSVSSTIDTRKPTVTQNVTNPPLARNSGSGVPTLSSINTSPAVMKGIGGSTAVNNSNIGRSGSSSANESMSKNSSNPSPSSSFNQSKGPINNVRGAGERDPPQSSARNEPSKSESGHWQSSSKPAAPARISNNEDVDEGDAPMIEESLVPPKRKFTGRCRLFVGNLTNDVTEEDFVRMFEPFGETSENFLNSARGFGFVRLDTRHNAENARAALDGKQQKGRFLRVRFAAHGAALRVKYLSQHVSNEMLEDTFSVFGDVERAVVVVDDRGRPTGDGVVEFARKPGALAALKRISEGVFLMTSSLRPIAVEPLEDRDECDGLPEIFFQKSSELLQDREQPPRFAQVASVEYEYGMKWKNLYQMYKEREDMLKRNFEEEVNKLEMDQETAKLEMHAAALRQDLQRRQEELRRFEEQAQQEVQRRQEMRMMEEERRRKELEMIDRRRRQGDMLQQQKEQMHQGQQQQQHSMLPQKQDGWQQQNWQQQAQLQQLRDGRNEQPSMLGPPPSIVAGMDRARTQGVNVIGRMENPVGAAAPQQLVAGQQPGNLRQIRYEPQAAGGLGASGGNMARELGGKSTQSAVQGNDEYFDQKRMRRF